MNKKEIERAAKKWAIDHSDAPDKDTPDWVECDFKAGANFVNDKQPYTPADMEALMNWMAENAFPSELKGYCILNGTGEEVTTTQLREMWEKERKEATE